MPRWLSAVEAHQGGFGFTVEFIPHLFATGANRPSGQHGLYGFARFGANVVDETAGALLNVTYGLGFGPVGTSARSENGGTRFNRLGVPDP